ncbi:hypothetical protein NX059_009394 [Plenodomus lindquistii]|nr:hypothetical protein NX059_009394 [Plenodomus lindquistii]
MNPPTPAGTPPMMRLPTPQPSFSLSTKAPSEIRTYSFEETNFARRLTRRALETGFQVLSTANSRPTSLDYVFRLSLPFLTPDQIRTRFKLMLSRGPDEDLDWWETPFIQLGGAGTHYPKRDASGRVVPFKNAWRIRQPGPQQSRVTLLEHAIDGRIESLDGVDLTGFEGEWFDAHDVQGYLEEEYRCKLDPGSSFAECLVEEDDSGDSSEQKALPRFGTDTRRASHESEVPGLTHSDTTSSKSSTSSSTGPPLLTETHDLPGIGHFGMDMNFAEEPAPASRGGEFQKLVDYDISFDQTLGLDLAPGFDYGWSGDDNMDLTMPDLRMDMMSNDGASSRAVRQKQKKAITVDVSRLIDEVIKHAICLGRSPGFRRKDVDFAVRSAAISTY